jgi:hypothetical protein
MNNMLLWPSPVMTDNADLGEDVNKELVELAKEWVDLKMNKEAHFKHAIPGSIMMYRKSEAIKKLFDLKLSYIEKYLDMNFKLTQDDVSLYTNTFTNYESGGEWSLPHGHHGNQMICTYYPRVDESQTHEQQPKLAGHMLFFPPFAHMPDYMVRNVRATCAIKLVTGTIVLFPGYLQHQTVPYANNNEKYAFITNVRFSKKEYEGIKTYTKIEEIKEFQS